MQDRPYPRRLYSPQKFKGDVALISELYEKAGDFRQSLLISNCLTPFTIQFPAENFKISWLNQIRH
jgi:hypothetical protein